MSIRQNAEELQDMLKELNSWQDEMKIKDEDLRNSKTITKKNLPPVRNQAKRKKKRKRDSDREKPEVGTRISSYDYRSWDKFDVDKVLKDMDEADEMKTFSSSEEESEETDEDLENEQRLQKALLEKDKGNALFKEGKYEAAINCYTTGIQFDPTNAVLPANRAMCLLKLKRYGAAEADCSQALSLDASYTKAYLRRGAARFQLGRVKEAEADYKDVLRLEPSNKQAQEELKNIAKKPLKRIVIEEIGTESDSDHEESTAKVSTRAQITASLPTAETRNNSNSAGPVHDSVQANVLKVELKDNSSKNSPLSSSSSPLSTQPPSTASTARAQSSPRAFAVPKSSAQFQADWRALHKEPDKLFQYFRKINPESYPKLFQQSLESEMLVKITNLLRDFYLSNGLPVFKELKYLSEVKRFSMAVMFLSDKDKTVICDLLQSIKQNKEDWNLADDYVNNLATKYGVS
ncbi:RNA polymerase II-associated protein 3 isoform X2 [Pocillopora verrucosa]|uniref:RNA polymerase II-associated protein 3 isoform X2 n=1 Tax=Pocillopora verrucosa TaxID=203993 RepID=UPI0033425637